MFVTHLLGGMKRSLRPLLDSKTVEEGHGLKRGRKKLETLYLDLVLCVCVCVCVRVCVCARTQVIQLCLTL